VYTALLYAASAFNEKARAFVLGRNGQWQRMEQELKAKRRNDVPIIHFHCASTGEFEQGRPVIEQLKRLHNVQIFITFFSPSGMQASKRYSEADYVFYLPLDFRRNAHKFVHLVKPAVSIFVKYEYWHHHLKTLHRNGVKCYLISAIFRPKQIFFAPIIGTFFRKILHNFDIIFVQNKDSQQLLQNYGLQSIISGDTRFDRVMAIASRPKPLDKFKQWAQNRNVLAAGSTWDKDETLLVQLTNEMKDLSIIFVPHEINQQRIKRLQQSLSAPSVRYSSLEQNPNLNIHDFQYIIVDTIGLLSSIYGIAQYAYIGGGFGKGIHNILEAAVWNLPVFIGANCRKFQEANDLIALGSAFVVQNSADMRQHITILRNDITVREHCSAVCRQYIQSHIGATQKILNHIALPVQ
jgi:3-deoxy-D-manno-octulosonic-acid transferase